MKREGVFHSKAKIYRKYIATISMYFLSLAAGIAVIFALPYLRHHHQLERMVREATLFYPFDDGFGMGTRFGISYLFYNEKGECLNSYIAGFVGSQYRFAKEKYIEKALEKKPCTGYELISVETGRADEHREIALVSSYPVYQDGRFLGCLVLVRGFEDHLALLIGFSILWTVIFALVFIFYWLLDRKNRQMEALRRTYIAGMSHELKSPITSIKALAKTLLYDESDDPDKRMFYYSTILEEADILENSVLKILELSKLQSKASLYKKEICRAERVFGEAMERYRRYCDEMEIALSLPALESLPPVYTAPSLMGRVLDLLLHNAVKFVPEDGGKVGITTELRDKKLIVHVINNGSEISPEDLPRIFDSFFKSETIKNPTGSGMGLAIVKEILNGLHETITVKSSPEETEFAFTVGLAG